MGFLKNTKLAAKLMAGFLSVALIAAIIGVVGISSINTLSKEDENMYLFNTKPMSLIAVMYDTLASQRICANNMVIFREADPEFSKSEGESLLEKEALFDEAFQSYANYLSNDVEEGLYDSMKELYYNDFAAIKANVRAAVASGNAETMADAIKAMDDMGSEVSGYMDEAFALNDTLASGQVEANKELSKSRGTILMFVMGGGVLLAILFAILLSNSISRPLSRMLSAMKQVGERGDLHFDEAIVNAVKQDAQARDEVGQVTASFAVMMDALVEKTAVLESIAGGDLTGEVKLVSSSDTIGNALEKMLKNLNRMFQSINTSAQQVSSGSRQMAGGAQNLAQGATEQAGTVERLSQSISQVAGKAQESAAMAERAARLTAAIQENAGKGSQQMNMMREAVSEISNASQSINKVIRAIDDIAFQTNILALNAAVEAARAGQHGRGFAVVAEEVRNLAQKSAESAKDTESLIAATLEKTDLGVKIAEETYTSLMEIVSGVQESNQIISEIAMSSQEQSREVLQINQGIEDVSRVVQQNSATAQESAAASEEMSGQASALEQMVSQFKIKNSRQLSAPAEIPQLGPSSYEREAVRYRGQY